MVDAKEIGKRLAILRGERTRKEIAELLGVSVSAISMYENGIRIPRDETKEKIAKLYNKEVQEIFFNEQCHEMRP